MKERNKKILKVLGVGALACVGMVGLTGCADVEISQDKVDSMVETVDKANIYMEEQLALLEEQNRLLQAQNTKLTKQDISDVIALAKFKILLNQDGVLNNLKISSTTESGLRNESLYFVNSVGTKMYYDYFELNDGNYHTVIYGVEDANIAICEWVNNEEDVNKVLASHDFGFSAVLMNVDSIVHLIAMSLNDIKAENIISFSVDEAGNYLISCFDDSNPEEIMFFNMIIDKQFRILEISPGFIFLEDENKWSEHESPYLFEYDVITDTDIEEALTKAQNAE